MHDRVWAFMFAVVAIAAAVMFLERERTVDERICRHAIQRNFGVERAEAERLIELERALER
jgi:hypothetical protein